MASAIIRKVNCWRAVSHRRTITQLPKSCLIASGEIAARFSSAVWRAGVEVTDATASACLHRPGAVEAIGKAEVGPYPGGGKGNAKAIDHGHQAEEENEREQAACDASPSVTMKVLGRIHRIRRKAK